MKYPVCLLVPLSVLSWKMSLRTHSWGHPWSVQKKAPCSAMAKADRKAVSHEAGRLGGAGHRRLKAALVHTETEKGNQQAAQRRSDAEGKQLPSPVQTQPLIPSTQAQGSGAVLSSQAAGAAVKGADADTEMHCCHPPWILSSLWLFWQGQVIPRF